MYSLPLGCRAYKLGKKRWSYNQVELRLSCPGLPAGERPPAVWQMSVAAGAQVPAGSEDSAVGFHVQLQSGHRLQAHLFVVYDRRRREGKGSQPEASTHQRQRSGSRSSSGSAPGAGSPGAAEGQQADDDGGGAPASSSSGGGSGDRSGSDSASEASSSSGLVTWDLVTRRDCCKGCQGCILRPIQRFGRLGKRSCNDAAVAGGSSDAPLTHADVSSGSMKDPKFMYVSIDEACTHVDASAFRLVAGIYARQGSKLLTTAVSPPIRVLANNDVPTGAARITLEAQLPADWEGWAGPAEEEGAEAAAGAAAGAAAQPPRRTQRSSRAGKQRKSTAARPRGSPAKPSCSAASESALLGARPTDEGSAAATPTTPAATAAADQGVGTGAGAGAGREEVSGVLQCTLLHSPALSIPCHGPHQGLGPGGQLAQLQQPAPTQEPAQQAQPAELLAAWGAQPGQAAAQQGDPEGACAAAAAAPSGPGACMRSLAVRPAAAAAATPLVPLSFWQAAPQRAAGACLSGPPVSAWPDAATELDDAALTPAAPAAAAAAWPAELSPGVAATSSLPAAASISPAARAASSGEGSDTLLQPSPEHAGSWQQLLLRQRRRRRQLLVAAHEHAPMQQQAQQGHMWGQHGAPFIPSPTDSDASMALSFLPASALASPPATQWAHAATTQPRTPQQLLPPLLHSPEQQQSPQLQPQPATGSSHPHLAHSLWPHSWPAAATAGALPAAATPSCQDWCQQAHLRSLSPPPPLPRNDIRSASAGGMLLAGIPVDASSPAQPAASLALPLHPTAGGGRQRAELPAPAAAAAEQRRSGSERQAALLRYSEAQLQAASQAAASRAAHFAAAWDAPACLHMAGPPFPVPASPVLPAGAGSLAPVAAQQTGPATGLHQQQQQQQLQHHRLLGGPSASASDSGQLHLHLAALQAPSPGLLLPVPSQSAGMPSPSPSCALFDGMASIFDDVPALPCLL